jgi:hypothetical protein
MCSRFRLRYSPCSDAYHRELEDCVLTRVGGNVRGWERGVYSFESVQRVVDTKNNLVSVIIIFYKSLIVSGMIYIEDITRRREDMTFIFEW